MQTMLYIALGGFVGAISRSSLAQLIVDSSDTIIPVGTLAVNLLGSFGLAFLLTLFYDKLQLSSSVKLGLGTGFFGSFTTFSTISLETIYLLDTYGAKWWLLYELLNVFGGIAMAGLGFISGKVLERKFVSQRAEKGS